MKKYFPLHFVGKMFFALTLLNLITDIKKVEAMGNVVPLPKVPVAAQHLNIPSSIADLLSLPPDFGCYLVPRSLSLEEQKIVDFYLLLNMTQKKGCGHSGNGKKRFAEMVNSICAFVDQGVDDKSKKFRAYIIGLAKIRTGVYILNTRQFAKFSPYCKSAINGTFSGLGYKSEKNQEEISNYFYDFPGFNDNELRRWTVRVQSQKKDELERYDIGALLFGTSELIPQDLLRKPSDVEDSQQFSSTSEKNTKYTQNTHNIQICNHLPVSQFSSDNKDVPSPSLSTFDDNPILNDSRFYDELVYDAEQLMYNEPLLKSKYPKYPIISPDDIPSDDHDADLCNNG